MGFRYDHVKKNHVVKDQGNTIGRYVMALWDCQSKCFRNSDCKSFTYCSRSGGKQLPWYKGACWLKDKVFDGSEQIKAKKGDCTSFYPSPSMLLIFLIVFAWAVNTYLWNNIAIVYFMIL